MNAQRCIHFTGIQNDKCKLGIEYEGFNHKLPCLTHNHDYGGCDKREFPKPEEIAAWEKEMDEHFKGTLKARSAIVKFCGPWNKGEGKSGIINCPVCNQENSLHFSRAGINGHIHAHCKTKECVSWME